MSDTDTDTGAATEPETGVHAAKSDPSGGEASGARVAAVCLGVKVPASDFLTETRIERINAARYEGQEIAGALHVVRETDRVLEVGAGLGVVGAVIALNARPQKLLSFEANPELIPVITALHEMNGLVGRIEVRNQVLWAGADRPDTLAFHLRTSFLGSSVLNEGGRPSRVVQVPTADLAEVIDGFQPTVLVMDIEGGELALLDAMDLSSFRAIVMEFHPDAYEVAGMRRCKAILRKAGFAKVEKVSTRTVWTCVREDAEG
ncbi:FkbM family methyltransferase [Phaeobacter sp. B1627]|uniref:FkbM family methyltransferase n=1 Tax=Phaeobacter sp. B1627 TaxID=2583809 RepID=UPI001118D2F8|nr:FkbM family methyltransferase [Phaeobacter sp. B1627]TNJ47707.1 FkbM family methyltransferase [Phaeobacter sp. B1627]